MEAQIITIEPNGVRRTLPITEQGLTIGRGADADLVINYQSASRYHARVMSDGSSYYIIDLGSTNGTFLGGSRLAPNVPAFWNPGEIVKIGDIQFELDYVTTQPGLAPEQPGERGGGDASETRVGWAPRGDTRTWEAQGQAPKQGGSRLPLVLSIVAAVLCLLAGGIAAAYFLFQ